MYKQLIVLNKMAFIIITHKLILYLYVVAKTSHQNSSNLNQNLNSNLVNRWIMNNTRPPKPNNTNNIPNLRPINRK